MPTKPNKAGQQQNYVPQGNGDASGEYADNQSGSNKHFTNFKQPESSSETAKVAKGATTETTSVDERLGIGGGEDNRAKKLKDRLPITADIEEKMKADYKRYLSWGVSKDQIKERLTGYLINGSYGDIVRPRDEWKSTYEDFYDSMSEWLEENKPEKYYYKSGNKWQSTYNPEWYNNKKLIKESEYQAYLEKETAKNLKQSSYDVEINKVFGEGCAVAFGKSYSNEYMEQIVESSKVIAKDFPDMNGFIKAIGDRNSLEKLTQARARESLTEENIDKVANEIIESQKRIFGRDITMEDAREKAKDKLMNGGLTLSRSGSRTLAYWSPSQRALVMLPKTAKDNADANQVQYYKSNWHSSDKPMATYYHEFGHAIDSMTADYYSKKAQKFKDAGEYGKFDTLRQMSRELSYDIQELKEQNISKVYNEEYTKRFNKAAGTNFKDKQELDMALRRSYNRNYYDATNEVKASLKNDGIRKYNLSEYGATNTQEFVAESFSAYYTGMNNELANKVVERIKKFYDDVRRFE